MKGFLLMVNNTMLLYFTLLCFTLPYSSFASCISAIFNELMKVEELDEVNNE